MPHCVFMPGGNATPEMSMPAGSLIWHASTAASAVTGVAAASPPRVLYSSSTITVGSSPDRTIVPSQRIVMAVGNEVAVVVRCPDCFPMNTRFRIELPLRESRRL